VSKFETASKDSEKLSRCCVRRAHARIAERSAGTKRLTRSIFRPTALAGYIRPRCSKKESRIHSAAASELEQAIERSRTAAAGADVPSAFYRIAAFLFLWALTGRCKFLTARAVGHTSTGLQPGAQDISLAKQPERFDLECARRFLRPFSVKCRTLHGRVTSNAHPAPALSPLMIVAGGCGGKHRTASGNTLRFSKAFENYAGTIISRHEAASAASLEAVAHQTPD
jgi:hypothetical protein